MEKVLCTFCKFEVDGRCIKKKSKVNLKKKRLCKFYQDDDNKIQTMAERKLNAKKPIVYFRPDWYWDRKNFIKKMKKEEEERAVQQPSIFTGDPEHPITGDLSRFFKSTVGEGKDNGSNVGDN
jgi:hypothetical protein